MSLSPSAFVPAQQKHALMASLWPCWRDAPRRHMKKTSQSSQHCRLVVRKSRTHIHLVHLMRNKRTQRPQTSNRQIQSQRRRGETERSTKSKNPEVIEDLKIISSQLYYHWKTGSYFWNVMNDINSFKSDPQIYYFEMCELSIMHWTTLMSTIKIHSKSTLHFYWKPACHYQSIYADTTQSVCRFIQNSIHALRVSGNGHLHTNWAFTKSNIWKTYN